MASTPALNDRLGFHCPNVNTFLYRPNFCDPGYWCGCADPADRCEISNDINTTAWAGRATIFRTVFEGLGKLFPPDYFKCDDGLYCPGHSLHEPFCPQLCKAGYYCPNATVQLPCPENFYCLMGSTKPTPCQGLQYCPKGSAIYSSTMALIIVLGIAGFLLLVLYLSQRLLKTEKPQKDTVESIRGLLRNQERSSSRMTIRGPEQKIDIAFQDLQLTLPKGLCIMEGVSGEIKAGSFCAILGPSGAGKTTFLSLISGKNDPTGGKLLINGEEQPLSKFRRLVGYVPQEDIMLRELTVYENIRHSAMMRLPRDMHIEKKLKRVEQVLESLDLLHVRDSIIGDELKRGISGGQRKRVNVAMELVIDPALICLDEPTSGLDSTSSKMLCESLVMLSLLGVNVSAVLHQPKYEIFSLFDTVLLLGVGGRTVYLGPAEEMVDYFTRIGFPLPPMTNPADYYMDVVAGIIPREDHPSFVKEDLFHLWEMESRRPQENIKQKKPSSSDMESPSALRIRDIENDVTKKTVDIDENKDTTEQTTVDPQGTIVDPPENPDAEITQKEVSDENNDTEEGVPTTTNLQRSGSNNSGGNNKLKELYSEDLFHLWEMENSDAVIMQKEVSDENNDTEEDVPTTTNLQRSGSNNSGGNNKLKKLYSKLSPTRWYKTKLVPLSRHLVSSFGDGTDRQIPGFFGQAWLLYRRAVLQRIRVPANTFWPVILSIFAGAVTGGIASAMGIDPSVTFQPIYYGVPLLIRDNTTAAAFFLQNQPVPPVNNVVQLWQITALVILLVSVKGINVFGRERAVFFRDTAGGTMVVTYWIAKTVEANLWLPLFSAVFSATSYGIQSLAISIVDYWVISWMTFLGCYGIGMCTSILVGLANRAIVTLVTGLLCILLFTGFLFSYNGKGIFKPFFTFWVAQAFCVRNYEQYEDVFDTDASNRHGAGYDLDNSFSFNVGMAFVTAFAWHVASLILLKVVDFRKQR